MIKRFVVAFSFIPVVLGLLAQTPALGDVVRPTSPPRALASSALRVGASFLIEPPMADYVRELNASEQREQIRDWAVLGTLTRFGATARQLAAATYQMPPARLAYLDELYAFEYGRGRRAYLGNRVLLFRDADDPDPQATIGRLVDRVRMENDEIPKVVELYIVDDQRDLGTMRVTRAADMTRDALFSKAFGYVEGEARDLGQLSAWLDQVDDLTFAKIADDGRLVLGGRRFAKTRTANITTEDVAAIYQAHQLLDQRRTDALASVNALPPIVRDGITQYVALAAKQESSAKADAAAQALDTILRMVPPAERDRVIRTIPGAMASIGSVSPGFSLDPEWLPDPDHPEDPLMLARLRAFAADPCADLERTAKRATQLVRQEPDEAHRTSRTTAALQIRNMVPPVHLAKVAPEVCSKLKTLFAPALVELTSRLGKKAPGTWDERLAPYFELVHTFEQRAAKGSDGPLIALGIKDLRFHEQDTQVQCARYEGVAGTRVGMSLFYTDLLAKLWEGTDFGHSAPIAEIPGFLSEPQMELPKAFEKEAIDNPYTRFWFGARSTGVSRSMRNHGTAFLFDHRFTRVYAAGSNPSHPGVEAQPAEGSRRAIGWWNRHFDEVADYEQEYHRQNQIMKWALVTAGLPEIPLAEALGNAAVSRGFQFAEWQHANQANLRFAETLPKAAQGIAGKECIPLLSSYDFRRFGHDRWAISGGVSTVGRVTPNIVPSADVMRPLGARVAFNADLEAGTTGTITRAQAVLNGEAVTFEGAPLARIRDLGGEISLGSPKVNYAQGPGRGSLAIRAGEGETAIGELNTEVTKNNVAIRWSEGPIERVRLNKPQLGAETLENADNLAKQGFTTDAARVYERGLPKGISPADKLAREAITDIARRRPSAVAAKLEQLTAEGKQVSSQTREALVNSVRRESEPVARQLEASLNLEKRLSDSGVSVVAERGRIILTRDVKLLPRASKPTLRTDFSNSVVYVDESLRIAQEGLLPDTGGQVARWAQLRGVKVVELQADSIGALPDRFVETSTGLTVERAPGLLPRSWPGLPPPVFLIQKCDADHKTATTLDDCDAR